MDCDVGHVVIVAFEVSDKGVVMSRKVADGICETINTIQLVEGLVKQPSWRLIRTILFCAGV